jgi:hypothetical protein
MLALPLALTSCSGSSARSGSSTTRATTPSPAPAPRTKANTTPPSGPGSSGTRIIAFDPYSAQGALLSTTIVTHTVTGTCVTHGVAGTSSYRCFAQPGSTVYDPCFAPPHATSGPLVCVADPAQPAATRFDVGALPAEPATGAATAPWAMRLSEGQACILVAAAWDGLGPFACPTPAATGPSQADSHQPAQIPTQAGSSWVADCQTDEETSSPFHQMQVITIWT